MTNRKRAEEIRRAVRENYAAVARGRDQGCCGGETSDCGCEGMRTSEPIDTSPDNCCAPSTSCCSQSSSSLAYAAQLGYSPEDIGSVPEGANMGLGCGNPQAIASLQLGEVVLDLGSGGGLDCFLAAQQVGETGRVIGVDMTPEMVSKARENAAKGGHENVDFRLGEIEHLPVADQSVDVVLSNCVINLSPDKRLVFQDAFRVLRPGGRLAIADIVTTVPLPDEAREDPALWSGCLAGAEYIGALEEMLGETGFQKVRIAPKGESRAFIREWAPGNPLLDYVVSATIEATKPG